MCFEGARSLRIDSKGDLVVTADDGEISFKKPAILSAGGGRREGADSR